MKNGLYHRDISTYCKEAQRQKNKGVRSKYVNKNFKKRKNIDSWVERIIARVEWREQQREYDL
jgi:ribosomal protein L20